MIAKGLRELARELGMSLGKVQALVAAGKLPPKGPDGYDVEAARRALAPPSSTAEPLRAGPPAPSGQVPTAAAEVSPPPAAPPASPAPRVEPAAISSPRTPAPDDEPDIDPIDPLAIAAENVRRAQGFAQGAHGPELGRALETVKKALEEYRRTQVGELAVAKAIGKVISLDDARATIGRVSRLYVSSLARLEAKLATQVELWLFDAELRALEPLARRRRVQDWFNAQAELLRRLDAAEIERMVAEESAEEN